MTDAHTALRPIRVAVIEDHPIMREATVRFLAGVGDIEVVSSTESIEEFMASLHVEIDVVALDLNLPGVGGLAGLATILSRDPQFRVLVLTMSEGDDLRQNVRVGGASGFLTKGCAPTELVSAVRAVAAGELVGLDTPGSTDGKRGVPLDEAEVAVLRLLVAGSSVGDIAGNLAVSFRQGALLIASIKQKTRCATRSEWLQYAIDHDLL